MPMKPIPIELRFWPKVNKTDNCWLWMAGKTHDGYGFISLGGGPGVVYAHRFAYESLVGPIEAGLQLDHLCRVRACVNPAHLEPVTCKENHARTPKALATHCRRGHEFTPQNTGRYGPYKTRKCRTCSSLISKQRNARRSVCDEPLLAATR